MVIGKCYISGLLFSEEVAVKEILAHHCMTPRLVTGGTVEVIIGDCKQ